MAIDFSQVKSITIPEGSVKQIADSQGNILWQEAVAKELSSITLSGQTTSLNRGDTFSFGGTVTANYTDGTTADVTSSTTFSGYNMSLGGTYTVTASYTEDSITKTATYTLTVNKAWATIWSGTKTVKADASGGTSGASSNFASTVNGTGTSPRIRITFTTSFNKYGSAEAIRYYNGSNSYTNTKPTSPRDFNTIASTNNLNVLGVEQTYTYNWSIKVFLTKANDTTNNRIRFSTSATKSGANTGSSSYYVQLVITKIEQYY